MSHFRRRANLFLIQPFRWFIISNLLATFGSGLAYIAMTWLVLQTDNSVSAVSILMLCFWLPSIVLAPWAGTLADKYSRKAISILSTSIRALILVIFATIYAHKLSAFAMYSLAAAMGVLISVYMPASMALVREIVPEKDLLYANSTLDITYELGHMVGMGCAGFIISYASAEMAIFLNGVFFALATMALLWMKFVPRIVPASPHSSFYQDFVLGLRYLANNRSLSMIYIVQLLIMVIFMTTPIILAPFAKNILKADAIQFGEIEAALSIGIVLGGLFLPYLAEKYGAGKIIILGSLTAGISFLVFSLIRSVILAEIVYFIIGICLSVWAIVITKAQHLTDLRFQGRVQATFNSLSGIGILTVYLAMHYFGDDVALPYLYGFEFVVAITAALLTWRYRAYLKRPQTLNIK